MLRVNQKKQLAPTHQAKKATKQYSGKNKKICQSIRSPEESHLRCLMKTKNDSKYCAIHLAQKNIIDFVPMNITDEDVTEEKDKIFESTDCKIDCKIDCKTDCKITNPVIRKMSLDDIIKPKIVPLLPDAETVKMPKKYGTKCKVGTKKSLTFHEQKVSTIDSSYKENEEDLEIKLLILANDDEYYDIIGKLIGPVFHDITLSEDDQDPVTLDPIWIRNEKHEKIPASVNKYYLFSYIDSKDKIRCLTIFTIYNMINNDNYIHPITMEPIPEKDILRAKKLIFLYSTKIGLFKEDDSCRSSEFKLKNRIIQLFKKFEIHNIYLEDKWFTSVTNKKNLYKIIKETRELIKNNIKSINPHITSLPIFLDLPINPNRTYIEIQQYIVEQWEKLIEASDTPQNQIPIWILVSGLSFVVPEIKQKFPDLEIIF